MFLLLSNTIAFLVFHRYGTAHTKTNSLWSSEFRRESMTESNNEVDEPPGTITSCTSIKEIENKLERAVLIEWLDDLKHHDWGEYPEVIVKVCF